VLNRRSLLLGVPALAGLACLARARPARAASDPAQLRVLRVRHRTLLVEVGGRRVLVDPCFAPALGAGVLFTAGAPALEPEEAGAVDILLVSSREPGAFDAQSTARLRGRDASCFVPDERTATILRHQGYRRVRVVRAGDAFQTRDVLVRMSPSRGLFGGAGLGFHLERSGRTLWCAGAPPPLDVEDGAARFAREHPAELVAASAAGLSVAGFARTIDREDALLLAGLARARYAVLLEDDAHPSMAGGLLLQARPGRRRLPSGVKVRVVVVEPGRWVRVMPR
jgi:L-ascorbate metabolism protein UlaG (beta-lactamase superfamily)